MLTTTTGALADDDAAAVRALASAVEEHDGIAALGEQALLDLADPAADDTVHVLAREDDGAVVGHAWLDLAGDPPSAELAVHPGRRRAGVGRALLDAVRAEATTRRRAAPAVWAHGDLPPARALAAGAGLEPSRVLVRMSRSLDAAPAEPDAPPDTVLRPFDAARDTERLLAQNALAFDWHPEQGRMSESDLRARQAEPWFDPAHLLMLEGARGAGLGFLWLKVEPGSEVGELYVVGIDPRAQGRGLGRYLANVAVARLAALGLRRTELYTEGDNLPAVRLYESLGFAVDRRDVQYR